MSDESTEETETEETTESTEESSEETEVEVPEGAEDPDAVRNAIKQERLAAKKANARARELEKQLQEEQEKSKPLPERIAAAEAKAEEAERRALRFEVAATVKLPLELASRLQGETEEEMKADAQSLLTLVAQPAQPGPGSDGGFRNNPPEKKDPVKEHNSLLTALIQSKQGRSGGSLFTGLQPAPSGADE